MPLKGFWLQLALCVWIGCLIEVLPLKILYLIACMVWLVYIHKAPWRPMLFVLVVSCCLPTLVYNQKPSSEVWQVKVIKANYVEAQSGNQKVLLYNVSHVLPDDVIAVKGKWEVIHANQNFYGFSFMNWANNKRLFYSMYVQDYEVVKPATSLRAKVYQRVDKLPKSLRGKVKEALYGIKDDASSLSYLVSSSGMHISWITRGIEKALLLCLSPFWAFVLSMSIMFGIGSLTVFTTALLRIMIFRIIYYLTSKLQSHDRLGICMMTWLFIMPQGSKELCFVLPVLFQLVKLFQIQKIARILTSGMVLIPIQLLYFYECDLIQVVSFKLQRFLYAIHYVCALFCLLFQCDMGITWMQSILSLLINIPTLTIIGYPSTIWLLCWLKQVLLASENHTRKPVMVMMALLVVQQYSNVLNPFGEVMFIDVGQGDTALITLPFGQGNIMIDIAGHHTRNIPKDIIYPILKAKGIEHIDTLLITHDDFDHSGGVKQLQELLPVHEVITKKTKVIKTGNLEIHGLLSNETFDDKNANSQLFFFQLGGLHYLFMGDGDKDSEYRLLQAYPKLQADILKIGHHGSNTSSSSAFLHQIHPLLGIISSGYQNRYGHPHPDTIASLKRQGITYKNTAYDGAISIIFFKNFHVFRTATHEFDIIHTR